MSLIPFNDLPDDARLWAYNTERTLTDDEAARLETALKSFLETWAAHGSQLTVGYKLLEARFILVGVDESKVGPSGCSIDELVRFLRDLDTTLGVRIIDAPDICFRRNGSIQCVTRGEFSKLAAEHVVDAETIVFDRTIGRVGDYRTGRWEVPAGNAWHGRAYELIAHSAGDVD